MIARPSSSLRARAAFVITWAIASLLAYGCRSYRTREFAAAEYPVAVANWHTGGHCRVAPLAFSSPADVSSTTGWP